MAEPTTLTQYGERVPPVLAGGSWPSPEGPVQPAAEPAPVDTQQVQGEVEGAPLLDDTNSIEFIGERFKLAERVGMMPLLRFANSAGKGEDSEDIGGMVAMYTMIRGIIHRPPLVEPEKTEAPPGSGNWIVNPEAGKPQRDETGKRLYDEAEWTRFMEHAEDMGAEGDELMDLVRRAMGVIAARPRQRRALSSSPSPTTSPNLRESSSSPDTPAPTRPDLDLSQLTPVRTLGR